MSGRGKGGKRLGGGGSSYYAIPRRQRDVNSVPTSYCFKEMITHCRKTEVGNEATVTTATELSSTSCAPSSSTSSSTTTSRKDDNDIFARLPEATLLHILSYLHLEDYRDLARLRQISKGMQSILPQYIRETMPYGLCSFYGGTSAAFFGGMLNYCSSSDLIGVTLDVRPDGEQEESKNKKSLCLFQGCEELQMVTVLMDMDKDYGISKEDKSPNTTTAAADTDEDVVQVLDYARLCQEILAAESSESFEKLSKEAAMKKMFLPLPPAQNPGNRDAKSKIKNRRCNMYLAIVTLKICPGELINPTCHRRGAEDGVYYLRACDLETYEEALDDSVLPCLPRHGDLSLEFRAYQLNANKINHGHGANIDLDDGSILVGIPMCVEAEGYIHTLLYPYTHIQSTCLLKSHQRKTVSEGVAIADGIVPPNLHNKLIRQIDQLSQTQKVDYHPHSNNIVRDLVHPALYAYVKGVSEVTSNKDTVPPCQPLDDDNHNYRNSYDHSDDKDYWGRKYEDSVKYQWLPTYFDVAPNGSCHICDYINNLVPRQNFTALYSSLEELFSQALPLLESTYSYGRFISQNLLNDDKLTSWDGKSYQPGLWGAVPALYSNNAIPRWSLKGQRLQVITKIVDYELDAEQKYEGVWHVEGMSHEEIVATAIYILERDDNIVGGNILFKRAIHASEAGVLEENIGQDRPAYVDNLIEEGTFPLGQVETLSKRLIAFPNSHVHRVTTLENKLSSTDSNEGEGDNDADAESTSKRKRGMKPKRRIVVFFLVNPQKRIISTREVPPQQIEAGGSMTYEQASAHRLELMKERKYTKQDWNVRKINLCEH